MGKTLSALLHLQSIERQLADVRGRLKTQQNAVAVQQRRIDQVREDWETLSRRTIERRTDADRLALDLKSREEDVARFRSALNTAKTNKEYAAILTQINTLKADNARIEEHALRAMQETDGIKNEADVLREKRDAEQKRLEEIQQNSAEEVARLSAMFDDLSARRAEASEGVSPEVLAVFNRIAESYDGEAMAAIEIHGRKVPHDYVCGGCYMSLNPEHANALRVRDQIRTCDNCGRILYLEPQGEESRA